MTEEETKKIKKKSEVPKKHKQETEKDLEEKKGVVQKEILDEKKVETKTEEKKEEIKVKEKLKEKKIEVIVKAYNIPISTKEAVAVCKFINKKIISRAILDLESVVRIKKAVPMKGEIPHRKGNIMSGRYPVKATTEFIKLLKSLKSNAIVNELELEKYVIFCKADLGSRPYRKSGRARGKRTNVQLKLILPLKKEKNKEAKNK